MSHDEPAPSAGPIIEPCAGGIVLDAARRLLVIRRGTAPALGRWSVPGGRCRTGEAPADACVREVLEETGVTVSVVRLAGRVERARPAGGSFLIDDFLCAAVGGVVRAGDDAADARWVTRDELTALQLVRGLWDALDGWGLLPD